MTVAEAQLTGGERAGWLLGLVAKAGTEAGCLLKREIEAEYLG